METYIVTYTSGTIRNSETKVICELEALNPENAVMKALELTYAGPEACSNWEFHRDSRTRDYVRLENPIGFVSDMVDHYAAFKGSLPRNSRNELHYYLQRFNRGELVDENDIWAVSAEKALESFIEQLDIDWPVTIESAFRAFAEKPSEATPLAPSEWIQAIIDDETIGNWN